MWILAFLFALFGVSALPGLMMNAVFVASLPALFVWTGRNMGFFSSGRLTAWMVALAPPILLWGPGLKREALVFLLLALFLLSLSLIYAKRWTWGLALAAIVSLALLTTRSSLLAVCAAGIVAMAVLTFRKNILLLAKPEIPPFRCNGSRRDDGGPHSCDYCSYGEGTLIPNSFASGSRYPGTVRLVSGDSRG